MVGDGYGQVGHDDEHGFYPSPADGTQCCFCGRTAGHAPHSRVDTDEVAATAYHDLASAVRFDGDRPRRDDGSLLEFAVVVADAYADRHGLPRFDSITYHPEARA